MVLARLEAAWRAEKDEPWRPLADRLGIRRSAFYHLRQGWRDHGLSGVIPHDTRKGRRISADRKDPAREIVRDLLRSAKRGVRNVDLAKSLLTAEDKSPDGDESYNARLSRLQRLERLVQHERKELAKDVDYLRENYGQRLIIDLTAINIVLQAPQPVVAIAAVVVDEASGLVMGSALGTLEKAVALQHSAIFSAIRFVADHHGDVRSTDSVCDVFLTPAPGGSPVDRDGTLRSAVRDLEISPSGAYGFGRALVQVAGPRIGRLVVAPRRTLGIDVEEYLTTRLAEMLQPEMARAVWEREVSRHNEPVVDALTRAGLLDGAGSSAGQIAAALTAVAASLPQASAVGESGSVAPC